MPPIRHLPLALAVATLLTAGAAHAEARRSAQSFPAPRMSLPAFTPPPPVAAAPSRASRDEPVRATFAQKRTPEREDNPKSGNPKPGDKGRDHFDNRRYDSDREDYERDKDHAGHHFGGHDRDDSPGC